MSQRSFGWKTSTRSRGAKRRAQQSQSGNCRTCPVSDRPNAEVVMSRRGRASRAMASSCAAALSGIGTWGASTKESPTKAMWQVSAARPGLGGSRSRNPRLLVRETVQKSRRFVKRTSVSGARSAPTSGRNTSGRTSAMNGSENRRYASPPRSVRATAVPAQSPFQARVRGNPRNMGGAGKGARVRGRGLGPERDGSLAIIGPRRKSAERPSARSADRGGAPGAPSAGRRGEAPGRRIGSRAGRAA